MKMLRRMTTVLVAAGCLFAPAAPLGAQEQGMRGRNSRIFVVPRPGPVIIDGRLDDWDLSGQIFVYLTPETRGWQSARVALMYDTEALYVSGDVRDVTPLMNRHNPDTAGPGAWNGDALQLRLCLDPKQGYPIHDAQVPDPRPNDQLVHMLLWYYTDRQEPNLHLSYGMNYAPPRANYPRGVVPHDKFKAAYRLAADKRGYAFEYRIPWATLEAAAPPKAGDLVAATLQVHWGSSDGQSLRRAAYDLLATPGYGFQSASCWGRAVFSERGRLPPEVTREGAPAEPPRPLTFAYELPRDSEVTVALVNDQGQMVRHLLAQAPRKRGPNVERWDGLDDLGKPLPAGNYTWKGLYHDPITTRYLLSVHNSGKPPYATEDGTGAWGADHGTGPTTVCTSGDHVLLAWREAEAGWGILRTGLDGRRQWGIRGGAEHLATDGRRVFASGGTGFHVCTGVEALSLADGRPVNFGNGKPRADLPPGGDEASNTVNGLACDDGLLYVALEKRNLVAVLDADRGTVKVTWDVPAPRRLAARPDGSVAVISRGRVLLVEDATARPFLSDHLDDPAGIAVDPAGTIYVANRGKLQNVSVFSHDGTYLRSIGKEGGRPRVGLYDRDGMLEPGGVAVDRGGKLWVAETLNSPRRISVWDAKTGRLARETFGASHYATSVCMDPKHEDEVYCHMSVWKVDLDKGTWGPHSTMWRRTGPDVVGDAYLLNRVFTARNGKQFAWGDNALYLRDGDRFKPVLAGLYVQKGAPGWPPYPALANPWKFPEGGYFWQDANDDQRVQADEVTYAEDVPRAWGIRDFHAGGFTWVDDDLNLWNTRGFVYRPLRFGPDGRPVYDFARPKRIPVSASYAYGFLCLSVDPYDGSFYTLRDAGGKAPDYASSYARWTPEGKLIWDYRVASGMDRALTQPVPRPGQLWGITRLLGVAGEFTGVATYYGNFHLFARDGLYVARLFKDQRLGEMGPDVLNAETFCGQLVRMEKSGRYLLLGGDTDGRVSEVLGLDSIRRFEGTHTITERDVAAVHRAKAEQAGLEARAQGLSIVRGRAALDVAPGVTRVVDDRRRFTTRAAYDEQNLHVRYEVDSPCGLVNSIPDPRIVFKGGNLLDLQLAADPGADPKRTRPAPGDVRLLVTRQQGQPLAVIYRPKVKGFAGQPVVLKSPTGQESFDSIEVSDGVRLDYQKTPTGFAAVVTVPLSVLGWTPRRYSAVRMDVGYLFGNATGSQCAQRAYWANVGTTAGIIGDVPSESRLEPHQWGTATVE
jgi:DNA-binding beta-propeller fold protein YncE